MKKKYYLRGLGFGILITAMVFALTGKKEMTDEEIVQRAKALGYVKQEAQATPEIDLDSLKDRLTPKPTATPEPTAVLAPETTKEPEITEVQEVTPEPEITPEAAPTPVVTPEPTKEPEPEAIKASVTIERGMTSRQACALIYHAGIVKSADELNRYIMDRGLADYINIGTFSLSSDMSYQEIVKILTGR